jgi:hypothetical protein
VLPSRRLDATLTAIRAALPHILSGKLGVPSARGPIYPEAATRREQGFPT